MPGICNSFALAAAFVGLSAVAAAQSTKPLATIGKIAVVEEYASGLEHPWGLAFLPDGRALVTEREGRLRLVENGRLSAPLSGVPDVFARGQGGLLDVAVDPQFETNQSIYLSYAELDRLGAAGTAVARARLTGNALESVQVIFRQQPKSTGGANHFGSRLVFARDGTLFVTLGDRFTERKKAQDLRTGFGKIMRINPDGSVPADNPFVGRSDAQPTIWSYGHRNVQGAALHPQTGALWTVEHGARGGDELNHPEAGRNYGWPVITYGRDYSGAKIGIGTAKEGLEQPVYYWDPSIGPSGLLFYTGKAFPDWNGDVFVGSLSFGRLVRLELRDGKVVREERYLDTLSERIRDVRQGPDDLIYLLTDSRRGRILRLRQQ